MKGLVFSPSASRDLDELDEQTFVRFGRAQSARTRDPFFDAFATLVAMPHSGHERPDLDPPGRRFRYR